MTTPLIPAVLTPLFSSPAMRAVVDDRVRLQRMLDIEAALARAEAAIGVIPAAAADPIVKACQADRYDMAALAEAAVPSGNLAIPLVRALTAEVAKTDADAARYVHWGATSQDIIDTALVLELRAVLDALTPDLDRAIDGFTKLAGRNRRQPVVARTWLQHAVPMPLGLKLAGYAAALGRARERVRRVRREALVLQFGGAAGTLAALNDRGLDVSERLAGLLDLPLPEAPWHTHRDRLADIATSLAILAGTCGKIARDVSLLMQTDVAEAFEPAGTGKGGSSTMPHKRNPVGAAAALAAATMAPNLVATILAAQVQEHERSAGAWQAEWPTFPALSLLVSAALAAIAEMASGLELDTERMRSNLDSTNGLIMAEAISFALAGKIGKQAAHELLEEGSRKALAEKKNLQNVLAEDARVTEHLNTIELGRLFEPTSYQGAAQTFIDRLIASIATPRASKRQ